MGSVPSAPWASPSVYHCQICFETQDMANATTLSCGHKFCKECFQGYLHAKVVEGQVALKCFHTADGPNATPCGAVLTPDDIIPLLSSEDAVKYQRFRANLSNPNARQCPKCDFTMMGSLAHPQMTCTQCNTSFCFTHSLAHPNGTCEAYERSQLAEQKMSRDLVNSMAKPCPNPTCGIPIVKSSGCNAMKCSRCGTCFCWLCGKKVDTAVLPRHFRWWNLRGCPNKQMVDDATPGASFGAFLCTLFQSLIMLPPILICTLLSFTLAAMVQVMTCKRWDRRLPMSVLFQIHFVRWFLFWYCLLVCVLLIVCCPVSLLQCAAKCLRRVFCCRQPEVAEGNGIGEGGEEYVIRSRRLPPPLSPEADTPML